VRSVVLLVLLAIAPAAWCQAAGEAERSALDIIDDCSSSAREETRGLTDLESECPGLTRALEVEGYLPLLSDGVRSVLDRSQLADLLTVDDRYDAQEVREVDVGTLGPILDSLRVEKPQRQQTWWDRFVAWLRGLLERQEGNADNWFARWLEQQDFSTVITRAILIVAIVLLIGVAIAVLLNELRAAGVLRKRLSDPSVDARVAGLASETLPDLDSLSADHKAPALLRMLVATLVRSGRLRTERSLTYRELCTRATFDDAKQRDCFRRVAALAERTVYGYGVSAEEVEPVVVAARALDAQLRGASA
jgi:hypothetical protein